MASPRYVLQPASVASEPQVTRMGRWVRIDRRYNQPLRLTGYAWRVFLKWFGLLLIVLFLGNASAVLGGVASFAFLAYAIYSVARHQQRTAAVPAQTRSQLAPSSQAGLAGDVRWRFNPPPNWPVPPDGWSPSPGWQPDPSWPPAPDGWQFWIPVPPPRGAVGERNSRSIPQDVKIAVSVRDQGMCVQCGSTQDLHYDHKIPWSRGGTNTVNNIQLLCGRCNRIKGADDIPVW